MGLAADVPVVAGWLVGRRSGPPAEAALRGAIAGGLASLIAYAGLGGAALGLLGGAPLWYRWPGPITPDWVFGAIVLLTTAQFVCLIGLAWLACLGLGAALGAVGGLFGRPRTAPHTWTETSERWWRAMAGGVVSAVIILGFSVVVFSLLIPAIRKPSGPEPLSLVFPPWINATLDLIPFLGPACGVFGTLCVAALSTRGALPATPDAQRTAAWLAIVTALAPWPLVLFFLSSSASLGDDTLLIIALSVVPSLLLLLFAWKVLRSIGPTKTVRLASLGAMLDSSLNNALLALFSGAAPLTTGLMLVQVVVVLIVPLAGKVPATTPLAPPQVVREAYRFQFLSTFGGLLAVWLGGFVVMLALRPVQWFGNWLLAALTSIFEEQ